MSTDPTPHSLIHGAAGFCTDHAQRPDERAETVARLTDIAYRAWCDARRGKPGAPGEYEALYSRIEAGWMTQVAAAVVAALDDESARLRYVENALAHCRSAGASYRSERDAARAALDRVRALLVVHGESIAPLVTVQAADLRVALAGLLADPDALARAKAEAWEAGVRATATGNADADAYMLRYVLPANPYRAALDPEEPR